MEPQRRGPNMQIDRWGEVGDCVIVAQEEYQNI